MRRVFIPCLSLWLSSCVTEPGPADRTGEDFRRATDVRVTWPANGETVREDEIPADLRAAAQEKREEMLDAVSLFSDELTEAVLEGNPTEEQIREAIHHGVIRLELCPVLMGSAYKNKGVQPLLDAVVDYLPNPAEVKNHAVDLSRGEEAVELVTDPDKPLVMLAFKLEDGP